MECYYGVKLSYGEQAGANAKREMMEKDGGAHVCTVYCTLGK